MFKRYNKFSEGNGADEEHQPVATNDTDSRDGDFDEHDNVLTAEDLALDRIKTKKRGFIVGTVKSRRSKIAMVCAVLLVIVVVLGVIIGVSVNKSGGSSSPSSAAANDASSEASSTTIPSPGVDVATGNDAGAEDLSADSNSGAPSDGSVELELVDVDTLPSYDLKPVMYTLELTLNDADFKLAAEEPQNEFKGHVDTLLFMSQQNNRITFHAQHMTIHKASIWSPTDSETYQNLKADGLDSSTLKLINDVKVDSYSGYEYQLELPDYNADVFRQLTRELLKNGEEYAVPLDHFYMEDTHGLAMIDLDGNKVGGEGEFVVLSIDYTAEVHTEEEGVGLYKVEYDEGIDGTDVGISSDYEDIGREVMLLTNNMQGNARKMWPCFDVPHMRAIFALTVNLPTDQDMIVLSNTVPYEDSNQEMVRTVTFEPTPPMSPYLASLIIGDFDSAELDGDYEVANMFDVYGRPSVLDQLEVPMTMAYDAARFYQEYTKVEQPSVFDFNIVAVPRKPYATDGWGTLLFDEERFLVQPITASSRDVYRAIALICHEVGHQWFGSLVGPQSFADAAWTEGLTSHMQFKCIEALSDSRIPQTVMVHMAPSPLMELGGPSDGVMMQAIEAGASPFTAPLKYDLSLDEMVRLTMTAVEGGGTEQHEVPLDHVLLATFDEGTIAIGAAFFGFVDGLVTSFYGVDFQEMLAAIVAKRTFMGISFEMLMQDVVDQVAFVHSQQNFEWSDDDKANLLAAFMKWVYTPGYPSVFIAPRTVDEDDTSQVWDINVAVKQDRFCIDGVLSPTNENQIGCFDQSPKELANGMGIKVAPTEYNLRSIVMNVQYLYGEPAQMFEQLRKRSVSQDSNGWIELERAGTELPVEQDPVPEDQLAKNGYIFIERKSSMAPLHLTLYPKDEYLNLADFFQDVLEGLDSVLSYEEGAEYSERESLINQEDQTTEEDLEYSLANKEAVADVLMDIYMIGRDVMKAAMSPIAYGNDVDCQLGQSDKCYFPQTEVLDLLQMFTMFRGSQHGVLQYSMGKTATELLQRYSAALLTHDPSCHQQLEEMVLPLFSLMADDMMEQLVARVRLGISDAVYDWNRKRQQDDVDGTPSVGDLVIDEDSFYKKLFLSELITLAHLYGDQKTVDAFASTLLREFLSNRNVRDDGNNEARYSAWLHELVHPDLQANVYMCALYGNDDCREMLNFRGGAPPFDQLLENALTQFDKSIRHRIITALATTPNANKARALVQFVFNMDDNPLADEFLKPGQEPPPFLPDKQVDVLLMTIRNPATREALLSFVQENMGELLASLEETKFVEMMMHVFDLATPSEELSAAFRQAVPTLALTQFRKDQMLSKLDSVEFWVVEHATRVCTWLNDKVNSVNSFFGARSDALLDKVDAGSKGSGEPSQAGATQQGLDQMSDAISSKANPVFNTVD